MRCVNNSRKIPHVDTIFYLTHLNHVGKTTWVPCALHVRGTTLHVFCCALGRYNYWNGQQVQRVAAVAISACWLGKWQKALGKCGIWVAWVTEGLADCEGNSSWEWLPAAISRLSSGTQRACRLCKCLDCLVAITCVCYMMSVDSPSMVAKPNSVRSMFVVYITVLHVLWQLKLSDLKCSLGPSSVGS